MEVGLALGAVTAGLSFAEASAQNDANKRAAESEKAAAKISAEERRNQIAEQEQQFRGTVRASSAARGFAGSASTFALLSSGLSQALESGANVNTQNTLDNASIASRERAQFRNPFFSAFGAGLSGFQSGTSIGRSLRDE